MDNIPNAEVLHRTGQALDAEMPKKVPTQGEFAFPFLISC